MFSVYLMSAYIRPITEVQSLRQKARDVQFIVFVMAPYFLSNVDTLEWALVGHSIWVAGHSSCHLRAALKTTIS